MMIAFSKNICNRPTFKCDDEVMKGWNLNSLLDDVKGEMARISTFPEDAEEPVVRQVTRFNNEFP